MTWSAPAPRRVKAAAAPPGTSLHAKQVASTFSSIHEQVDVEEALQALAEIESWLHATPRRELAARHHYGVARSAVLYAAGLTRRVFGHVANIDDVDMRFLTIRYNAVMDLARDYHETGSTVPGIRAWFDFVRDSSGY